MFKINTPEKILDNENELTVFPARGGIITSIKIKGVELLYQDMYTETLLDSKKSVKGGIPYMFPNAGPLSNKEKEKSGFDLPQHGIGRINQWKKVNCDNSGTFAQKYSFDETDAFPFQGSVVNTMKILESGVNIIHEIENTGIQKMPISTGIHPYFRLPEGKKEEIKWNFPGGDKIVNSLDIWANDGTITFDNPGDSFDIEIPGLGTIVIEVSSEYKKFWVWSMQGKDFVCIEPVMGDVGGIVNNPIIVKPRKKNVNFMRISLKK